MTITPSYIPSPQQTNAQVLARATTLGIGLTERTVPPVYAPYITTLPGVVAEYGSGPTVVYQHDDGTLTAQQITNAIAGLVATQAADVQTAANQATASANVVTVRANVAAHEATLLAWIAANPSGAVLTAGQTLVLANMLVGLCRLLEQDLATTVGT